MKKNLISAFLISAFVFAVSADVHAQTTLRDAFKNDFLIGAALNQSEFEETDKRAAAIVKTQFNSITPEDVLKWESVHPKPGVFDFKDADQYVAFGVKNKMFIVGHVLIWYHQTPDWVFQDNQGDEITRPALLARMRKHIFTVVGRYKGKIGGWDVVPEALNEDGSLHRSQWMKIIGPDYIAKAYQFAHEADPSAQLYYDDYNLVKPAKRRAAIDLIAGLKSQGISISAVGMEGHYRLDWPSTNAIDATIKAFSALGVKVVISELDINMQPSVTFQQATESSTNLALRAELSLYTNGLPSTVQQSLAKRYADIFRVFLANRDSITRVTFWGVTDGQSWLNNWPVKGRTSYPLVFDRNYKPKPAFDAIIQVAREENNLVNAKSSPP